MTKVKKKSHGQVRFGEEGRGRRRWRGEQGKGEGSVLLFSKIPMGFRGWSVVKGCCLSTRRAPEIRVNGSCFGLHLKSEWVLFCAAPEE